MKPLNESKHVCTCGKKHENPSLVPNRALRGAPVRSGEKLKQILYDTRSVSGTTQSFAEKLGRALGIPVFHVSETEFVQGEYILCTFTDGVGEVPRETKNFLQRGENSSWMRGVVANGSSNFKSVGLFGMAGDRIQAKYGVHLYKKLDMGGTSEDLFHVAERLNYDFSMGVTLNKKEFKPASTFRNGKFNFASRKITSVPQMSVKKVN